MIEITTVVATLEGSVDDDHPPIVLAGHLTLEQATRFAQHYGSGYPHCSCVLDGEGAAWYANFSNDANPPLEDDGRVQYEHQGHLELRFYIGHVTQPTN
jgi:hypothetical protein